MKMPTLIETVRLAPATRYADQPLTLRTRFTGMATTLAACAAVAVIGLWQVGAPTPTVSNAPALSVMNVAPLAAPPAAQTDKPSGKPQEEQERASEPEPMQQQADAKATALPASALPPIQRIASANTAALSSSSTTAADIVSPNSSAALSEQSAEQNASAPPASNEPSSRVASAERDRWESQVLAALNRVKHYPREATRLRQEGISWICITMDQRGKVRSVRLHKQSGHRVLDQEALAMASRASPLPRPPASLKMLRIEVTVPIAFSMDRA